MKDIIEVYDEYNNVKKMEVVTIFNLDEYDFNYIIYKELDKSNYCVAKYRGNNFVNLNTDLSTTELLLCNKAFKEVIKLCN